ncbi:MAG: acyltransferase [Tatlockia sp.]|nr:acyltransferase [Tatlockia sp.]
MKNLLIQILFVCCFLQASCVHRPYPANNVYNSCASDCVQKLTICTNSCSNNCQECVETANNKATKNYRKYVHEQCIKGKNIALQLNSFRDPLQCQKITCNCPADYDLCMQSCSRTEIKRLQYAPLL